MQGQYNVKVGEKFRIAFPSSYRDQFGEKIIITYGFEQSLIATSEGNWNDILKREVEDKSFLQSKVRDIRRFFLGGVSNIEFDNQGRFVVPEYLRDYPRIQVDKEVTFVWQREYIEIWDKKQWEERQNDLLKNISMIAESLGKRESNE